MFAAVDLGSNSFRLHIGEHDGLQMHVVKTARNPIHLASGLDSKGFLTHEAQQKALHCLKEFKKILSSYPLEAVKVVGTNTLRIAKNSADFLPLAEKTLGYPIEIIPGEEEGRLIYMGVANSLLSPIESRLVSDIGGGSTEVVVGKGYQIERIHSFPIGTHKQTIQFFPKGELTHEAFDKAIVKAKSYFEKHLSKFADIHWQNAYGSSGTMRTIAAVIEKNKIGDKTTSYDNLLLFKNYLINIGHVEDIHLIGLRAERAAVLVSGLSILLGIMETFHIPFLSVTNEGLRMGVLWELYNKSILHNPKEQAVLSLMQKFHTDLSQSAYIARLTGLLYEQLTPNKSINFRHLYWSGLLSLVGHYISQHNVSTHSAYIAANADVTYIESNEQLIIASLIDGSQGDLKKLGKVLTDEEWIKAFSSLRLAIIISTLPVAIPAKFLQIKIKGITEIKLSFMGVNQDDTFEALKAALKEEQKYWNEVNISLILKKK